MHDGSRAITFGVSGAGDGAMTDPTGAMSSFHLGGIQSTSATTRPVPFQQLIDIFTADNPTHANMHYDYDPLGQILDVQDAYAVLHPGTRGPYTFFFGDGTRGERDDPLGGAYAVNYDTYGHPARYTDESGASQRSRSTAVRWRRNTPIPRATGAVRLRRPEEHGELFKVGTTAS